MDASEEERHQRRVAQRPPWQIPRQHVRVFCQTKQEQETLVGARLMHMLRRSCFELYFSTSQAQRIVAIVPEKMRVPPSVSTPSTNCILSFVLKLGFCNKD